jgi:hypothetical protein
MVRLVRSSSASFVVGLVRSSSSSFVVGLVRLRCCGGATLLL